MKTKDIKKGISLIVLIVTIIVVIILAAVVILTLSKNNPIESAKEARFKEDVRTFQDELALYISKQYANAGGHWDGNISAKTCDEIKNYIPSFTKKYEGKFIINNNNLEHTNKLDEKEKEYAQNLNIQEKIKLLPDEYQQVEYIESTGTQYIDTRYYPNNLSEIKCKFMYNSLPSFASSVFGVRENDGTVKQFLMSVYNEDLWVVNGLNNTAINGITPTEAIDYIISISPSEAYWNEIKILDMTKDVSNCPNYSLYIFGRNTKNGFANPLFGKVYYLEIYEQGRLTYKFIPCYSTTTVTDVNGKQCSSGTKGLYDTVEGKFYTNQGTGEFIAGPEVDE